MNNAALPHIVTASLSTMPAVLSGTVLVTGATGYIAGCIIETLLQHNIAVRGTVRSESKGSWLKELYSKTSSAHFETVVVEDISEVSLIPSYMHMSQASVLILTPTYLDRSTRRSGQRCRCDLPCGVPLPFLSRRPQGAYRACGLRHGWCTR